MKNNSLAHHLRVLMESNEIKERRDGVYKRFYAYDYVIDPRDIFLSRTKENIVEAIGRNPGATVKELAESVSMPVQTVSSNLGHLYEDDQWWYEVQFHDGGRQSILRPLGVTLL